MEPEGSLPHSQQPATCSYSERNFTGYIIYMNLKLRMVKAWFMATSMMMMIIDMMMMIMMIDMMI
jgi:hypothetical protein